MIRSLQQYVRTSSSIFLLQLLQKARHALLHLHSTILQLSPGIFRHHVMLNLTFFLSGPIDLLMYVIPIVDRGSLRARVGIVRIATNWWAARKYWRSGCARRAGKAR